MKRLLPFLLVIMSTIISDAQKFAPIGAEWYYSASAYGLAPTNSEFYHYQSKLDTFIAGHSCTKISITYYQYKGSVTNEPPIYIYQSNDTVFYFNDTYSNYFPLYIYNVSKGDTLTYHIPDIPTFPSDTLWKSIVDSVSLFIVGSDTLKRVWTSDIGSYSFWGGYIELIGSPFLMLHQPHIIYPEWDGPLRCYSDNRISYNFSSYPCDKRITNGIHENSQGIELFISPNPSSNFLTIKNANDILTNYTIYNISGQMVLYGQVTSTTTIAIDKLNQGLYSIEFKTNTIIKRKQFVIER